MSSMNPPIQDWSSQRVWVIGASSGIGAALAQQLFATGARVVLSARRAPELAALTAGNPRAAAVAFDAADANAWDAAHQAAQAAFGGLDLVVFVAARYDPQRAWELDAVSARRSFELNVLGVYEGLTRVLPALQAQGHGGVALVASVSGYTGLPKASVYGATKAALINLAETLYFDLAPRGLAVYLINPGFVATPMTARNDFAMPEIISPEQAAQAIVQGLEQGEFEIRFPKRFTGRMAWLARLPYRLRFWLLHKTTGL